MGAEPGKRRKTASRRQAGVLAGLFGLLLAVHGAPAAAFDPPLRQDAAAVAGCLAAAWAQNGNGLACADIVSAPCLEQPDAQSNIGMQACYDRGLRAWDAYLNEAYRAVLNGVGQQHRGGLRDAQRAWIAQRDKTCDWAAGLMEGGTGTSGAHLSCLERETALRAIRLWQFRRDFVGN